MTRMPVDPNDPWHQADNDVSLSVEDEAVEMMLDYGKWALETCRMELARTSDPGVKARWRKVIALIEAQPDDDDDELGVH